MWVAWHIVNMRVDDVFYSDHYVCGVVLEIGGSILSVVRIKNSGYPFTHVCSITI